MTLRVLSVPASHVYVRHLADPDGPAGGDVVRLLDPPVPGDVPAAQWWPPPALEPDWVRAHAGDFGLAHVHFGFDARTPDQLAEWVATLRELGKPLVLTAHDLRNPHHADRALHDAQLDVLVPAADALVTLTPGAAAELRERWGRDAQVLPHPHVVPAPELVRPREERDGFVVGVHLKSLRANMAPLPVVSTLAETVAGLPGATLLVDVHTDVVTEGSPRHDPAVTRLLREEEAAGRLALHVHDFYDDAELWDYLRGLDLSVLPYRFGTHSGWLEACHDLGTAVLAPDSGYYAQQRPCLSFHVEDEQVDATSLRDAVVAAHAERPGWRATPAERHRERAGLARAHRDLYAEALGR